MINLESIYKHIILYIIDRFLFKNFTSSSNIEGYHAASRITTYQAVKRTHAKLFY